MSKSWFKLDNAAKVFPSTSVGRNTSVFRLAAVLREPVDGAVLAEALEQTRPRYPMLTVRLKKGVFWNYLEKNDSELLPEPEDGPPMGKLRPKQTKGFYLRVLYAGNRISLEIYHCLCDGNGGLEFLKTLLYFYFALSGRPFDPEGLILLPGDGVRADEGEDAFAKYARVPEKGEKKPRDPDAYRLTGTPFELFGNNLVHGVTDAGRLNALAKSMNCTVTSYLAALLLYSVYRTRIYPAVSKKPLAVAVPVNLRREFPSRTLRNFFVVPNLSIPFDGGSTLASSARAFESALREAVGRDRLQRLMNDNAKFERNRFVRTVPLAVKNLFVNWGFQLWGENKKTVTLSNLGRAALPAGLQALVSHLEVGVYPTPKSPYNCGVISACGNTCVTFSRTVEESDVPQFFFSQLAASGLKVEVYGNEWGGAI